MPLLQEPNEKSTVDPCWEQLKSGDKSALQALYVQYANLLYNYGRHIVKDGSLVKDCIQDLFVELWQNHHQLSSTTSVKFYLYKALRRKLIYETKKTERQLTVKASSDEEREVHYLYEFSESEAFIAVKRKEELQKLLEILPDRQKEVLTLVFFDNLTRAEAAEVMGVDTNTIYTLVWRAVSTLKKEVQTHQPIFLLSLLLPFIITFIAMMFRFC